MSRRPGVHSEHEQRVEAEIQEARRARDERLNPESAGSESVGDAAEPTILSASRGPVEGGLSDDIARWIEAEAAEQRGHYRRVSSEIEALAPSRDRWVEEFLARITGPRGFSVHAGTRRTISEDEISERPERPWRLVW